MAYQINKTDGTVVATVADGQVDQLSTNLTLIGKNYSGFGEALNENFVKLLENFANTTAPTHPIRGQIWFDSSELKLKVYSGSEFLPVSSATISGTQPSSLGVGDLWFNSVDEQLYFYDGSSPILLGPAYSASQNVSGLKVVSLLDTLNQTRVITLLYTNGILLGIFSKDSFTPKNSIDGFSGSIIPGFNAGNLSGLKFNVTCTNAESLGGSLANTYVKKDTIAEAIAGTFSIVNDGGLNVGTAGQAIIRVTSGNVLIANTASDRDLTFGARTGSTLEDAIKIQPATRTIGLYETASSSQVNIGGSLTVGGNLTVEGTTTTVNSTVLEVADKNVVLASGNGVDAAAREGGIMLEGSTPHILLWTNEDIPAAGGIPDLFGGDPGNEGVWNSSENINLSTGRAYYIDGVEVINSTSLGATIENIPGVTSFGTLSILNVGPLGVDTVRIEDNKISIQNPAKPNLEIEPIGDIALIGLPRITGLADPLLTPGHEQDAATREYVDSKVEGNTIVLSMDLSDGKTNAYIITNVLNNLAPPGEHRDGTVARILCSTLINSTTSLDLNPSFQPGSGYTLGGPFDVTGGGSASAVTAISVGTTTVSAPTITVQRTIKYFSITSGVWGHDSDLILPP